MVNFGFFNGATAGGRCVRKLRFSKPKTASVGYIFFQGLSFHIQKERDDATENDNFHSGKQRLQGRKIF